MPAWRIVPRQVEQAILKKPRVRLNAFSYLRRVREGKDARGLPGRSPCRNTLAASCERDGVVPGGLS